MTPYQPSLFTQQSRDEALKSIYAYIEKSIEKDRVRVVKMKRYESTDSM